MRSLMMALLAALYLSAMNGDALAKRTTDAKCAPQQQRACMKNYAGPACRTEHAMCLKSCRTR